MLHNDLSNKAAPILAFNFERVICEKFHKGLFRINYDLNHQNISGINTLYHKDFSIYYVSFEVSGRRLDRMEKSLDAAGCMYNGSIYVANIDSLNFFLRQQVSAMYFDTNKDIIARTYPFGQRWESYLLQVWNVAFKESS